MPILFNKVARANPQDRTAPKKWYAVLKTLVRLSEKDVAKQIADETTLNRKEAEMAMAQLEKVVISSLLNSESVPLGDWGTLYLTCNSSPSDTKEGVTANNIGKLNIRFLPGKALKDALGNATFIFAENVVSK